MAIMTHSDYLPHHALPIYIKVEPMGFNSYEVGEEYEARYEDSKRAKEKGEDPPFNYAHEAILVGKSEMEFGDINPLILAFCGSSRDYDEAVERVCASDTPYDDDREVKLLTFMRKDKSKEFILNDAEPIDHPFTKEDTEA